MTHLFQLILNLLNSIPADSWNIISNLLFGAISVSVPALAIKKWLNIEDPRHQEKIMLGVVIFTSMIASGLLYLHSVPEFGPWFVLVQGWGIFATSQPVYFLFFKPLYRRLSVYFGAKLARAATASEAKSALVPPQGLTLATQTSGSGSDFGAKVALVPPQGLTLATQTSGSGSDFGG